MQGSATEGPLYPRLVQLEQDVLGESQMEERLLAKLERLEQM